MEKILAHLFFFFFSFQIFSPYIGGRTLYLELIVALLDPYFWKWVINKKKGDKIVYAMGFIFIPLLFLNLFISIKILSTIILVLFLSYTWERKLFFLKYYLVISILVAVIQFVTLYIAPEISIMLGPENLSKIVWGSYQTPTYTNFYSINGYIPRVSGLSRESGFLASYIITYITLLYVSTKRNSYLIVSAKDKFILTIGFVMSFSKISLVLIFVLVLEKIRNVLNRYISPVFVLILFVVGMTYFWYHNNYLTQDENITYTHRFGGYAVIPDIEDINVLLFGEEKVSRIKVDSIFARNCSSMVYDLGDEYAGLGGTLLSCGILMTLLLFLLFIRYGVNSTGILVLLLLTINVNIFTNQNFVIMAYFIVLKYYCKHGYSLKNGESISPCK